LYLLISRIEIPPPEKPLELELTITEEEYFDEEKSAGAMLEGDQDILMDWEENEPTCTEQLSKPLRWTGGSAGDEVITPPLDKLI